MFPIVINVLIFVSAVFSIVGDRTNNRVGHYIFKPFTMLLIIGAALSNGLPDTLFTQCLLIGLLLSLCGDVFLMLPKDRFVAGLASFLLAHIAYLVAFFQLYQISVTWGWVAILAIIVVAFYRLLSPTLGQLKIPVMVYIAAIIAMLWMAGELYFTQASNLHLLLLVGAIIFAVSDSALAWNKFKQPFKGAQWVILLTYFAAQSLFGQALLMS